MYSHPTVGRYSKLNRTSSYNLLAGWQYILQPKFRAKTHQRWQREKRTLVTMEVLGGLFGMGVITGFVWFVSMMLWALINTA